VVSTRRNWPEKNYRKPITLNVLSAKRGDGGGGGGRRTKKDMEVKKKKKETRRYKKNTTGVGIIKTKNQKKAMPGRERTQNPMERAKVMLRLWGFHRYQNKPVSPGNGNRDGGGQRGNGGWVPVGENDRG